VDNRSNQGIRTCVSAHSDEYFIELCALSSTDALTTEEWKQLQLHLSVCPGCREIKAQYDALLATTLPAMAAEHTQPDSDSAPDSWSMEQAEAALMERIERESISPDKAPQSPALSSRWRLPWPYLGAAIFVVASTSIGYYFGTLHGHPPMVSQSISHFEPDRSAVGGIHAVVTPERGKDERRAIEVRELRHQLQGKTSDIAILEDQMEALRSQLAKRTTDLDNDSLTRADLEKQLSLAQASAQELRGQLDLVANQAPRNTAQSQALQEQVRELTAAVQQKDQEIAQREELLQHDRDIRDLIGARDLYLAEIYDVAKTGKTQKPFGRVFYTKGKSLVFYAYDLDQQPGVKLASTFQAWGRKGIDQGHDVNLGIFYQDDQNKKRWILKSDDPVTLSQIDAVFVTVEPHGESAKPSGKPLLFTYLRLAPNHP
jgi:hypothetical protein